MKMAALALVPPTSCCQSYFETYVFMRLLVRHSTVLYWGRPLRQVRAQTVRARGLEPLADSSGKPRHLCRVCLSLWAKESSP